MNAIRRKLEVRVNLETMLCVELAQQLVIELGKPGVTLPADAFMIAARLATTLDHRDEASRAVTDFDHENRAVL